MPKKARDSAPPEDGEQLQVERDVDAPVSPAPAAGTGDKKARKGKRDRDRAKRQAARAAAAASAAGEPTGDSGGDEVVKKRRRQPETAESGADEATRESEAEEATREADSIEKNERSGEDAEAETGGLKKRKGKKEREREKRKQQVDGSEPASTTDQSKATSTVGHTHAHRDVSEIAAGREAARKQHASKFATPAANITCFKCGKVGHTKAECRMPIKDFAKYRHEKRQSNLICLRCRKKGHAVAECPEGQDSSSVGICFNCGGSHTLKDCPKPKIPGSFPFATCFVCGEMGHLAGKCSKNAKGIYPRGGSCKRCSSVHHLAKDCDGSGPRGQGVLGVPAPQKSAEESQKSSASKRVKIVKF